MSKKREFPGIEAKTLFSQIEHTAGFIFNQHFENLPANAYLLKLQEYSKDKKKLKEINYREYFYLCLCAHWSTAGTIVPTDVDNAIRLRLWKDGESNNFLEQMKKDVIDAWSWNYTPVTNRKVFEPSKEMWMSTHEGTWFSVAIGAYFSLEKKKKLEWASEVLAVIKTEIKKEEEMLSAAWERKDYINFLKLSALVSHNLGDLDRVFEMWEISADHPLRFEIYKLGHQKHKNYSDVFYFMGKVNKEIMALENHRHMSLRGPKCLRRKPQYSAPIGPFFDEWGEFIGADQDLSKDEKVEIICALFEGWKRQDRAFAYVRAYHGIMKGAKDSWREIRAMIPVDILNEIKVRPFGKLAEISKDDFMEQVIEKLSRIARD